MNDKFRQTIKLLQKLPGVGPRQAARFVLALLEKDGSELIELGQAIANLKRDIKFCKNCFNLTDNQSIETNGICHICSDDRRDQNKLMVVEKVTDLDAIEKTKIYKGLYHVLGGAINPLDGLSPDALRFKELEKRIGTINNNNQNIELIIATNTSTSGETTALYIKDLFKNRTNLSITRLGRGLASGSNLEYADELTLRHSLESRK